MIIPGYSAYDISTDGVVTHLPTGKVLRHLMHTDKNGTVHARVTLANDRGQYRVHNVIRLLALAYLPLPNSTDVACPKDGDYANITVDNVVWCNRSDVALKYANPVKRPSRHCTPETRALLLNALEGFDRPVSVTELSCTLEVPYGTARYTIDALVKEGLVTKTKEGCALVK